MTDLIEKARQGRMNALALRAAADARIRTSDRRELITFISSRARQKANATLL
jgi:hypothetical protein